MRQLADQAIEVRLTEPIQQSLLELAVRVNINRISVIGQRGQRIFAEIKTGNAGRLFSAPMTAADIAVLALFDFRSSSGEAKFAWPMKS